MPSGTVGAPPQWYRVTLASPPNRIVKRQPQQFQQPPTDNGYRFLGESPKSRPEESSLRNILALCLVLVTSRRDGGMPECHRGTHPRDT